MIQLTAAVALVSALVSGFGVGGFLAARHKAELLGLRSEYAAAQFQALEKAHAETIRLQEKKDEALKNAAVRQSAMARAAAAVRDERDGLRDELAASRSQLPDASCASVREHAATLNTVFGLCSDRLEGMAGDAQGHAIDSLKLQESWPK